MKKFICYVSIIVSFALTINVLKILTTEFERLTKYGLGYLTGKVILLLVFLSLIYLTRGVLLHKKGVKV